MNATMKSNSEQPQLEVFFDGLCPMCAREINMLRGWDTDRRIRFTDIASSSFDAEAETGKSLKVLMRQIHARRIGGKLDLSAESKREPANWFVGVEVFRQMYGCLGFRKPIWISRMPVIRHMLDLAYRILSLIHI